MTNQKSLQEKFSPEGICFGCGPAQAQGLRIRSFEKGDGLVAQWKASAHHQAFPGMLNGGIIGALLDCHSNWAAAWALMKSRNELAPPCTVTAEFHVKLLRPTPFDQEIFLFAKPVRIEDPKVFVEAELKADGKVCATCTGLFVAVKPGHPAYHRW